MKLLGIFLAACVVLAVAQAAAVAISLALALGLVVALFTAPKETFDFLITMAALGVLSAAPIPTLLVVAFAIAANWLRSYSQSSKQN